MDNDSKLVIVGAGGHAKVAADIAAQTGFRVVGFIDDVHPDRRGEAFAGATVLGGSPALRQCGVRLAFVAVGDCATRLQIAELLAHDGFRFTALCHPRAVVAPDVEVRGGAMIAAGAVANPGAVIEAHAIVNTGATVDHDCLIGEGAHIGPGAHLGGRVRVGRGAWVGIGASVKDGVAIGDGAIVGAGAVVIREIPARVVAYGVPAAPRRPA